MLNKDFKKVESCFSSDSFKQFMADYNFIIKNHNNFKGISYWGLNFKKGKAYTVKYYIHVLSFIDYNNLMKFIPTLNDFNQYKELWNFNEKFGLDNFGLVLELKFNLMTDSVSTGFFFLTKKTEQSVKKIGVPRQLEKSITNDCISIGVNFEYEENGNVKQKAYYYFRPSDSIQKTFDRLFNSELNLNVDLIEYAESEFQSKVNFYFHHKLKEFNFRSNFSEHELNIIDYFNNKYRTIVGGHGIYKDEDIKSIYFFDKIADSNLLNRIMDNNHKSKLSTGILRSIKAIFNN